MNTGSQLLALIPARGGSKSVPRKNILPIVGKPLIAWTIAAAKASGLCDPIIVSTDDPEIAAVAKREGADVPFLRPPEIARDDTPDFPVFKHAVEWLEKNEGWRPEIVAWLRPTSPLRTPEDICGALRILTSTGADAVRSVCAVDHHPYWMKSMDADGRLAPVIPGHDEHAFPRRQLCPPVYALSGLVDVIRVSSALRNGALFAGDVRGYAAPADRSRELDTSADIEPLIRLLCPADPSPFSIDPLEVNDAPELSRLILEDDPSYRTHFAPFPFDEPSILARLVSVVRDRFWAMRIGGILAGFFMLRGFDEGFERPSFGVYIGERYAGLHLASLALHYALAWCAVRDISAVMLKVHPNNTGARGIYESAGFSFEHVCPQTGHHILVKVLRA
jgi:CMP-N-acetylneuraminic acid synthetase/RimJ/RimL family protein N-acetyltransferase